MTVPLIEVDGLRVSFPAPRTTLFGPRPKLQAVRGVSFNLMEGETFGLVGESGSGKSTIGRALLGLNTISAGSVKFRGEVVGGAGISRSDAVRRHMQMVFQDPYSSVDRSMKVADIVAEPIDVQLALGRQERTRRIVSALEQVGLGANDAEKYPDEFSGGQRQRIAIARALIMEPSFIVCDEAVSALDTSTKNQIMQLLTDIQKRARTAYLFISHDLPVVRHMTARVGVMYAGKIVESGPSKRVCESPAHPYSAALISASPAPHPRIVKKRIVLSGEAVSPLAPPPGCAFHPRCAYRMDICATTEPAMTPIKGGGEVACHLQTSGPVLAGKPLDRLSAADSRKNHPMGASAPVLGTGAN